MLTHKFNVMRETVPTLPSGKADRRESDLSRAENLIGTL